MDPHLQCFLASLALMDPTIFSRKEWVPWTRSHRGAVLSANRLFSCALNTPPPPNDLSHSTTVFVRDRDIEQHLISIGDFPRSCGVNSRVHIISVYYQDTPSHASRIVSGRISRFFSSLCAPWITSHHHVSHLVKQCLA